MRHCLDKEVVTPESGLKAIGPYSLGIIANHFVFTAGQIGLDPETGNLAAGGVQAETRQALVNLRTVLEEAGSHLDLVVKTTVFLRDINDFAAMNEVYAEFFNLNPPARSAIQVAALPRGAAVEIEAVAVRPCEKHNSDCD